MSEKLYALLLRLYPASFRQAYGNEAMQLVRDRLSQETGLVGRVKLWLDLLSDFAVSLPREYRSAGPALANTAVSRGADGTPSFHVLEEPPLRAGTILAAVVCAFTALGTLSVAMKYAIQHRPSAGAVMRGAHAAPSRWAASPGGSAQRNSGGGRSKTARAQAPADTSDASLQARPVKADQPDLIDGAERERVVQAAVENLERYYFDHQGAASVASALLTHDKNGDYSAIVDGPALAATLTRQMRNAGQNFDLTMEYSRTLLPDHPQTQTAQDIANYQSFLRENQCFFKSVAMRPHAVGYMRIDGFADPSVCRPLATKAMESLYGAKAVVFDLRLNRGGDPGMAWFVANYLFHQPEPWYNPRGDAPEPLRRVSPVAGSRLTDTPVYVLTSPLTWSAAEQFSYDLKAMKRATIVGETTGGGAHAGAWHRIDDHFGMGIPEVQVINPWGKSDWEGTGVEPDIKVKASEALTVAEGLAAHGSR